MWTRKQLCDAFHAAGIRDGDLLLVHSSLRKLGPVEGGADTVIDTLLDTIGVAGTLVLPTHTWKTVNTQQPVFHQTLSVSCVGVLSNVFRVRPGVVRSLHPTHSLAAMGPRACALIEGDEQTTTPCSRTSPYARLRDWGGKVLVIGEDLACCTLFHGCEEWAGLPQALSPQPIQLYSIRADGEIIPVSMHHYFIPTWLQYPRAESFLLAEGAMTLTQLGTCELRLLDAGAAADLVTARLRSAPGFFQPPE